MNREDIIKLAKEAGYGLSLSDMHAPALERFAHLVAAAERNREDQKSEKYFCPVCNSQEMVRAKFDEESG